jgi:hypothetical protein
MSKRRGSYEAINYGLRPAKNIERKMLSEAFRRLTPFGKIESFRYVGFGSTYFSDFILFHKTLGIINMISIEHDVEAKPRFEFNKPFSCITIEFGDSNDVLTKIPWDVRTIVWLDFDGRLTKSVLTDVRFFFSSAPTGSLGIFSVNANPDELDENEPRLDKLKKILEDKVPPSVKEDDLADWGTASVYRHIIQTKLSNSE